MFGVILPSLKRVDIHVSFAQVRIFPYLIGRESAFADNLKWMACANKGLGLFDKHLTRQLCVRVHVFLWSCVVWLGMYISHFVHLCVYMCMYCITLFLPRGTEVALGGVQRSICSNPSSCQCLPLWLLTPDGSHVSTLCMSGGWKGNSQVGKHITVLHGETRPKHLSHYNPPPGNNFTGLIWCNDRSSRSLSSRSLKSENSVSLLIP